MLPIDKIGHDDFVAIVGIPRILRDARPVLGHQFHRITAFGAWLECMY
jgi:hypothetical protein